MNSAVQRLYVTRNAACSQHTVRMAACGDTHTAALTDNGALYTMGRGVEGQLGTRASQAIHVSAIRESKHGRRMMDDARTITTWEQANQVIVESDSSLSPSGVTEIFVRTNSDKTIIVNTYDTLTTNELLMKIGEKVNLSNHRIVYASRYIEAGRLLVDYNIQNYSTLQLTYRLLGGMDATKSTQHYTEQQASHRVIIQYDR